MKPASEVEHTPTPWHNSSKNFGYTRRHICGPRHADGGDYAPICSTVREDDAAFIVKAVNNHDALVAALHGLATHPVIAGLSARIRDECRRAGRSNVLADALAVLAAVEGAE